VRSLLLALAVVSLLLMATRFTDAALPPLDAVERAFLDLGQDPPIRDPRLDKAAGRLLQWGAASEVRTLLRSHGIYEGLIFPLVLSEPELPEVQVAWHRILRDQIDPLGVTHYGVHRSGDLLSVVFVRRVFTLHGLPYSEDGLLYHLEGRLEAGYENPRAILAYPDGRVVTIEPVVNGDFIKVLLPMDAGSGDHAVEVIANGARGTEVVALVSLGTARGTTPVTAVTPTLVLPDRVMAADAGERILQLLNHDRRRFGRRPLSVDSTLQRTAKAHARSMANLGVAAHRLPGGKSPSERLRIAGVSASRFYENVAMARTVEQAHAELWSSPSHRLALLDPHIRQIGVGVETRVGADGPILFIVQHLAHK